MKTIIVEKLPRILKNKKKLEKELKIKITNRGKEVTFEGKPEDEYLTEKIFDAIEFGFPISVALSIKREDNMFEIINIKDYTNRDDLERIRGRIIGKKGKALATLSQLTKCNFELKDNSVGIVGDPEYIQNAQEAIISIVKGSKHSNVYGNLERHQPKPIIDLGLKE